MCRILIQSIIVFSLFVGFTGCSDDPDVDVFVNAFNVTIDGETHNFDDFVITEFQDPHRVNVRAMDGDFDMRMNINLVNPAGTYPIWFNGGMYSYSVDLPGGTFWGLDPDKGSIIITDNDVDNRKFVATFSLTGEQEGNNNTVDITNGKVQFTY